MEQQGPVTWDFQNNRIKFGDDGKWLALQEERQWLGVRRVFRSQYAMSCDSPTVTRMVRKVTCGQKYAASVNVVTKTKENVFGLAGGGLPPRRSTFNCKCLAWGSASSGSATWAVSYRSRQGPIKLLLNECSENETWSRQGPIELH